MDDRDLDRFARRNRPSLIRVSLFVGMAVVLAAASKEGLSAGVFSSLLWLGSVFSAVAAVFTRDRVFGPDRLTRWDEAAILMLLSLIAGLIAEPPGR